MKQALEIDDLPERVELLTAAEQQIIFVFQNGRFATGSLTRRFDLSRLVARGVQEDPLDRSLSDNV